MADEQTMRRLRVAAGLVAAEAAGAFAFGIAEFVRLDTSRLVVGLTTGAFFCVYAAGLAAAALGLLRVRSWSRSPVVLAQFIELGLAWSFYGDATQWVAILLAAPAIVVLVVIFAPATTRALYGQPD